MVIFLDVILCLFLELGLGWFLGNSGSDSGSDSSRDTCVLGSVYWFRRLFLLGIKFILALRSIHFQHTFYRNNISIFFKWLSKKVLYFYFYFYYIFIFDFLDPKGLPILDWTGMTQVSIPGTGRWRIHPHSRRMPFRTHYCSNCGCDGTTSIRILIKYIFHKEEIGNDNHYRYYRTNDTDNQP